MTAVLALAVLAGLLGWAAWTYNRLVRARALVAEAWSGIDVQLRRRRDLVPALVEVVRAYGRHERETLEAVTALRAGAPPAGAGARATEETRLTRSLRQLLATAEAYPELRASEQFLGLQARLTEVEDHLQLARRYYNGTVRELNILVEAVPSALVAGPLGFRPAEFFEIELATERAVPEVRL
jgi:LemA protein